MKRTRYEHPGFDSVDPGNELEEDVLRRAILPDDFDNLPGQMSDLELIHHRLLVTGGRLVVGDGWCQNVVVHYELRERIADGWYALRISFWHRLTLADLGGLTIRAALWTFPPLVQARWLGHPRKWHCHPVWATPHKGDWQLSGNVRLVQNLPQPEATHLLAVSATWSCQPFEWGHLVPHLRLADPSGLKAE